MVVTYIFFPDAQSSKTTKLLAFLCFSGRRLGGPGRRLDEPGRGLDEPGRGLDGPGRRLNKPGRRLNKPGLCLGATLINLKLTF